MIQALETAHAAVLVVTAFYYSFLRVGIATGSVKRDPNPLLDIGKRCAKLIGELNDAKVNWYHTEYLEERPSAAVG